MKDVIECLNGAILEVSTAGTYPEITLEASGLTIISILSRENVTRLLEVLRELDNNQIDNYEQQGTVPRIQ